MYLILVDEGSINPKSLQSFIQLPESTTDLSPLLSLQFSVSHFFMKQLSHRNFICHKLEIVHSHTA